MQNQSKRQVKRDSFTSLGFPVSCVLRLSGQEYIAEVVNYHYNGACLKFTAENMPQSLDTDEDMLKLDFYVGAQCISRNLGCQICWEELAETGMAGLRFSEPFNSFKQRAERFIVNPNFSPTLSSADPLDPNRKLFFKVRDFSETGLLLETSLANRHLLPGMNIKQASLMIPGHSETINIDLGCENTRKSTGDGSFLVGMAVNGNALAYRKAVRSYLSHLGMSANGGAEALDRLSKSGLLDRRLKGAVTYRVINEQVDYEKVLKLRFDGYAKHKKVTTSQTWEDMGEGLQNEGTILAGYIGGVMVCSMELRFGCDALPLRLDTLHSGELKGILRQRTVEINKLVVNARAQGSDIVLGLIQRAHAIVVSRGYFDVLLAATNKLKKLYLNIGAEDLKTRVQHPSLEGEGLNLMVVRSETYLDGQGINPYAWDLVYRAAHEYFSGLGIARERHLTKWQKLSRVVSAKLASWKMQKKAKKKEGSKQSLSGHQSFIDPKWTKQEILATVMYPYILEAIDLIGHDKVTQILAEIGVPENYIAKQSNWLSIDFHDEFLDLYERHGSVEDLSYRAGKRSMQRDVIGLNYFVLKHFLTPELAFQSFAKITSKFNRTRTYEVFEKRTGHVKVAVGLTRERILPRRGESCQNWITCFESYIELMTGERGRVRKTSCLYNGDQHCCYEIKWNAMGHLKDHFLSGVALSFTALGTTAVVGLEDPVSTALAVGSVTGVVWSLLNWMRLKLTVKEKRSSELEFQSFQLEAEEKYRELQNAKTSLDQKYKEAKHLEQTAREVQSNYELSDILRASMDAVCNNFNFDRAFLMLVDEERKALRTSALAGIEDNKGGADLWSFSVDVKQKRESPMVLSSVFHTGQPVIINDVERHLFQLNKASQSLLLQLKTRGFVMVQIPGENGSWGVLVADRVESPAVLDRSDLVLLQRVAQQVGIALDKRSRFEQVERIRNVFQKYVPKEVVEQVTGREGPVLGGQTKDVVCMFIDIRSFTSMSANLPPRVTIEILNRFFTLLESELNPSGALIDKFLGDGALVTWGAVDSQAICGDKIITTVFSLLQQLKTLNAQLREENLPNIKVGMGLHRGEVVVGNIGSESRMEFTCIGSAVNLAARLEGLCKPNGACIVASAEFIEKCQVTLGAEWTLRESVEIRGLIDPLNIYLLKDENADSLLKIA